MATLDNSKKYLVHNIYGEAQTLIDNIGSNVAIPAGWSDAAEANRKDYVDSMNTVNSGTTAGLVDCACYPTVFYYRNAFDESYTTDVDGSSQTYTKTKPAGWYQFPVEMWVTDKNNWTWTYINEKIQWLIDNKKSFLP